MIPALYGEVRAPRAARRMADAFSREERSGLMLAALVRTLMLLCATLFFALASNLSGMPYLALIASIAGLALIGLLQFLLLHQGYNPPWLKYAFVALDCAYLTVMFAGDFNQLETNAPPALIIREGGILFFLFVVVQTAFSFSPGLMVWAAFCITLSWSLVLTDALLDPVTIAEWWIPAQAEVPAYFQKYANPAYLPLSKWAIDTLCMALITLGLAFAVARSRKIVVVATAAERARANLSRYFSPRMVETLAARDDPFGATRRQTASILFADIRGFTAFAEATEPEDVMDLLRAFHARMEAAVFDAGGTLHTIMGDGLMASFGVPDPSPDDTVRALGCAGAMLQSLDRWNKDRVSLGLPEIRIGIGIHRGLVVLGDVGSERSSSFSVVGDTVNTSARLQTLTKDFGARLIVSGEVMEAVKYETGSTYPPMLSQLEPCGPQSLRGREGEIDIWAAR